MYLGIEIGGTKLQLGVGTGDGNIGPAEPHARQGGPPRALLFPVLLALLALFAPTQRTAVLFRSVAALGLFAFSLIAIMSVGIFFMPSAVFMATAAVFALGNEAGKAD
jgi:hypothetical protein